MPQTKTGSPRTAELSPQRATKKLAPEELDKSVARLTVVKERKQETEPLAKSVKLSKAQMDGSVDRLYANAVEHKKKVMNDLEAKTVPAAQRQVLDSETISNSVQRVYSQAVQHKKEVAEKLKAKHATDGAKSKKLTKTDQQACNERAYSGPMQKRKEKEAQLEEKYIHGTVTKFKVMNKEQWNETVGRLAASK